VGGKKTHQQAPKSIFFSGGHPNDCRGRIGLWTKVCDCQHMSIVVQRTKEEEEKENVKSQKNEKRK